MTNEHNLRQTIDSIDLGSLSHSDDNANFNTSDEDDQPHSYSMLLKLASAGLSFFCAGMNDGSLGVLIPRILRSYEINTDLVSVV